MVSLLTLAVAVIPALYLYNYYRCFARNLAAAKTSNLTYVVAPVYVFNRFWLVIHRAILPLLYKLPGAWTESWIQLVDPEWTWKRLRAPFEKLDADTFLTVSPGGNMLWCADPNAITQITSRRIDFPKPIELYGSLDIYGKNVVSTEGAVWRQHRKVTSPPFTEKNNHLVWTESLHQARCMLQSWLGPDGAGDKTAGKVADDTMRLSLHVISRAGFGVRLLWPGVEDTNTDVVEAEPNKGSGRSSSDIPPGHTMRYIDALGSLLHNILIILLVPSWILTRLPYKKTQKAHESFIEWGKYMREMYAAKKAEVMAGEEREGLDLMGALAKGAGITSETVAASGLVEKRQAGEKQTLTDDDVLGNAFVFVVAGHETTANSIHFSLLYLALDIKSQRKLQRDLDSNFHGRPVSEWNYDRDLPHLFGGMAGAVLNEQLRLIPPVLNIPKKVSETSPQTFSVAGKKVHLQAGTSISLVAPVVHRNPKYWPHGPPSDPAHPAHPESNRDNDLEEFKPDRWLLDSSSSLPPTTTTNPPPNTNGHVNGHANGRPAVDKDKPDADADDLLGLNPAADTAANFFRPPRGAYIPFSEGFRACLGRRFAQVEVLAVLAVIFSQYSVELAVDEFASDEEVSAMDEDARREVWGMAAASARERMRSGMGTVLTLQMRQGSVPLRFVRRGEERFGFA